MVQIVPLAKTSRLEEAEDLLVLALSTAQEVISTRVAWEEGNLGNLREATEEMSSNRSSELGI